MISFKKLVSHSIIYAVGPQLPKVVGLLILPLITPFLTSIDYGIWGIVIAYSGALSAIKDLGLVLPLVNSFYHYPIRWKIKWRQIYGYLFCWSFIYFFIQTLILFLVLPVEARNNRALILILLGIPVLFFDQTILIGNRYFQLLQKPIYLTFVSIISGLITVFITYISIVIYHKGYMGWFFGTFSGILVQFLLYLYPIFIKAKIYPIFKIKYDRIKKILSISLPLIPHNYSSYLLNASDRVVMSIYKTPIQNVGLYNIAYMWGAYIEMIGSAVGQAVGPFYLELYKNKTNINSEDSVKNLTIILQLLFMSFCFVISLWIKNIFEIFIKQEDLKSSYSLALIIIMSYSYFPMYWNVINRLQYNEKTKTLWKITTAGGIINVFLNLILMPFFGYKVAVFTTFFSLMYIGFSGYYIKVYKELSNDNLKTLRWLLLIIIFTSISYLFKDTSIIIKILITFAVILINVYYVKFKNSIDINAAN